MPKPEKAYPVRLVGTRNYAAAIKRARIFDAAAILREVGNPHDADALVVVDGDGATLGYIPRDNWVRRAIVDEGRGGRAVIESVTIGADGIAGMTIFVTLTDDAPIGEREFVPAD